MTNRNILEEDLDILCHTQCIDWEKFHNKHILVTGGTGLIGSTLIKALLYASKVRGLNLHIHALVRNFDKAFKIFGGENNNLELIIGTLESLPEIFCSIDYIIHGANPTASLYFVKQPVETIQIAVDGTFKLLTLAREKGVKSFVYLSSMEVYGAPLDDKMIPETQGCTLDSMAIRSCYPIAKRLCENLCASFASEYNVPTKVVRLAQTFGPGVAKDDARVFAEFARDAIENRDIILQTDGSSKRMYLYTADAVSAILTILLRGKSGCAYNAANPETYCSIREMAELVASEIANNKISVRVLNNRNSAAQKYPPSHHLRLDSQKLLYLGWQPRRDLKEMYLRMLYVDCFK